MADSNLGTVRSALRALKDGDVPGVIRWLDADVEMIPIRAAMEGTSYRGHEGFRQFYADITDDWDDYRPDAEDIRDIGEDRVLVVGKFHGRGKASGVEVETPAVWVCQLRDARITNVRFYNDEHAALEALGLHEQQG
jgi:ketosteroid isomerase-like protein